MPKLSKSFNTGAARTRTLIPDGVFLAVIGAADVRIEGDAADEETIAVQLRISVGQNDQRKVFEGFRINNPSETVREIAEKGLVQLLDAVGLEELTDTDELVGKQVAVRVTTQTSAKYPPRNRYSFMSADALTA